MKSSFLEIPVYRHYHTQNYTPTDIIIHRTTRTQTSSYTETHAYRHQYRQKHTPTDILIHRTTELGRSWRSRVRHELDEECSQVLTAYDTLLILSSTHPRLVIIFFSSLCWWPWLAATQHRSVDEHFLASKTIRHLQ